MVVHPAAGHAQGTLVNALLHEVDDLSGIGGELRPGIVHRLDRGTSGLMVVAKNDRAHVELSRQFHDREVEKEYIALVWGVVQAGKRIDLPIGRDPVDRKKMSAKARRARSAVTRITAALHMPGVTLIHVAIATGTHASDSRALERNRPSYRRRRGVRRHAGGACPAICGRCSRSSVRSCTPAASSFSIPPTDVRWSSRRRCLTTCNSCSIRSCPKTMSEAPPDLKQSDVIYKGRVFNITVDHVAYPDGRVVKMECVRHRGSVVLLPMTATGRILLVRQYRYVVDQWLWELPAGTLEPNENRACGRAS